jgi:hypothetical protein
VAGPHIFYGARFANQAMRIVGGEAPLVQAAADADPQGRSFDEILGESAAAIKARSGGQVLNVDQDGMDVQYDDPKDGKPGKPERIDLYHNFPFNRKTTITHTALRKAGDRFEAGGAIFSVGQFLARSPQ